ncbi:uncharacterized protein A4U43_UnF11000, partial [Asparagus officinalis]
MGRYFPSISSPSPLPPAAASFALREAPCSCCDKVNGSLQWQDWIFSFLRTILSGLISTVVS